MAVFLLCCWLFCLHACMHACMHASRALASLEVQEVQESQAAEKKLQDAEKKLQEERDRVMYASSSDYVKLTAASRSLVLPMQT